MCCNFAKLKENFAGFKKELTNNTFRRFNSAYHAHRWIDFEKILTIRTLASELSRILLSAIAMLSGTENWDLTEDYIEKGGLPNQELAVEIYPYAKAAN